MERVVSRFEAGNAGRPVRHLRVKKLFGDTQIDGGLGRFVPQLVLAVLRLAGALLEVANGRSLLADLLGKEVTLRAQ